MLYNNGWILEFQHDNQKWLDFRIELFRRSFGSKMLYLYLGLGLRLTKELPCCITELDLEILWI